MTTGEQLTDFITQLNADVEPNQTLIETLVRTAQTVLEGERPWMVLRKTDTSKSVTTANTWQTEIDLSTITDFSRFLDDTQITLFDGNNLVHHYFQRPFDRRLEYKDVSGTFVYDANAKKLYLNGVVPFNGTLYINYISNATAIDISSSSAVWSVFPSIYLPIIGFYAVGIFKGAVDYDSINRQMLPENRAALGALKAAMEKWDDAMQLSSIQFNEPGEYAGYPRDGAINRYDD